MRAIYSYGIALVIVLVLAVWMATGTLVDGGHGPGNGEKPVVSLIEKNGGPLTNAVEESGINKKAPDAIDPAKTIAERNDDKGAGANAAPRSVRIMVATAQLEPIDVPLRGRAGQARRTRRPLPRSDSSTGTRRTPTSTFWRTPPTSVARRWRRFVFPAWTPNGGIP